MTLENIIYDIKSILSKSKITTDFRVLDRELIFKINNYRALYIIQEFNEDKKMDTCWLQNFSDMDVTCIDTSDDPNITGTSVKLGKVSLPSVVSLSDELGTWSVRSSSNHKEYYPIDMAMFWMMVEIGDQRLKQMGFFYKIGDIRYIHPYVEKINAQLVVENPLDCPVILNEIVKSGNLEDSQVYKVYGGQVVYNGTTYNPDDTFTCTYAGGLTYTGYGYLKFNTQKRSRTVKDDYPLEPHMAQKIILDILTKDYQIEATKVADMVNDGTDQFQILSKNG